MGLFIAKFLSECFTPVCIDDCVIEEDCPTIIAPVQQAHSMELYMPPPPELEIDLEAGKITGPFGVLSTSYTSIKDQSLTEIELVGIVSNPDIGVANSDEDDVASNPSDKTFDYGVIVLDQTAKKNDQLTEECNDSISEDSLFDDVVIV